MAEINKAGIPDKNTVGRLGDICINTVTGDRYKLAYISTTTTYDGTYTDYEWVFINDGLLSADTIKEVDIVTELPETEENGVLYVVSDGLIVNIVKINGTIIYDRYEKSLIVRYTASESGLIPTFNDEYVDYEVKEEDNGDGTYTISVMTNNIDNLPTTISFNEKNNLLAIEKFNVKNTSKVTNMSNMFYGCNNLTSLDLSGFDTSKVTNMSNMFYGCDKLTSLGSMMNICANLTLPSALNKESILDVVDNLATVTSTKTLKINAQQLSWISEDKIREANNKGWTISA